MTSNENSGLISKFMNYWSSFQDQYIPIQTRNTTNHYNNFSRIRKTFLDTTAKFNNNRDDKAWEEIKRYEDFTTIDWVQDAICERSRMNALRIAAIENRFSWNTWFRLSYESSQAWIVVSIVGAIIGLNAALTDIITEWLSDLKFGYCKNSWWLNQKFCCWEIEMPDGSCDNWQKWTNFYIIDWFFYVLVSAIFAAICAYLIRSLAPYGAGSGISEIKCILAGFIMKGFLGGRTLLLKSVSLPLAIGSGLSIGKEGPAVHTAACVGNVVSRMFGKYTRNKAKMREILSASCAAGVAVAFGSPIGGVLFSFEEMSSNFPMKTMWRSFFCALVATAVLQAMNPFRTGKLVMFQVTYDKEWHYFEIFFFAILGAFGGLYGTFVTRFNLKVQYFRKKYLKDYAVTEAVILAVITAIFGYLNIFMKLDMTEALGILFEECEGKKHYDYEGLCKIMVLLLIATILRTFFIIISYGAKVPAGIFVPSMAVGATFGRFFGLLVKSLHAAYPTFPMFAYCKPDVPCVTPGMYAFLGAAAALSGVMQLTVCVVVIMFELTGALTYILPTMITLMITKTVCDLLGKGGIADQMIRLNGFPFLDKEEYSFGVPVSAVMRKDITVMTASGLRLDEIDQILLETNYQGFPVVQDKKSMMLLGCIGRVELKYAIDKAKRVRGTSNSAHCFFNPDDTKYIDSSGNGEGSSNFIDFAPFIDQTPITVHPRLPLETVMDLFKKMGPRVILIEHVGRLVGLVTVKDVLKYIAQRDAEVQSKDTDNTDSSDFIDGDGRNLRRKRSIISLSEMGKKSERNERIE
ncbi:chloride channel [Gigaspora rosea]|uniref:Chloride channel protein n=1 Tax=Gigaspora rosea TaxID=44941 RepID=A0A397VJM7_9GLOM|nr:chloride channel [Gigaspora rosea]